MNGLDDATLGHLAAAVAGWTGFQVQAIPLAALERAVTRLVPHLAPAELRTLATRRDPRLANVLFEAVSVGESFFYRHPEHFRHLEAGLRARRPGTVFRVWSAGCATGEEAYSLAACLDAHRRRHPDFHYEVLGTDLLERNVHDARAGRYRRWSLRDTNPLPADWQLFEPATPGQEEGLRVVRAALRECVHFAVHNLLDPAPPGGPFDLILCRNVLIYLAPASVSTVCEHLRAALAPEGEILLAPVDLAGPIDGLQLVGEPSLQVYRAAEVQATPPAAWAVPSRRSPVEVVAPAAPTPLEAPSAAWGTDVALHLRALADLERGARRAAEEQLVALRARQPRYLPGLLELALLWAREGRRGAAAALMRELRDEATRLPPEAHVGGPEPLTAAYYLEAARAFLETGAP